MRVRPERVAERIKREAADILENQVRDPRVSGMVSVTDVEVTPDLSYARIYVSVLASSTPVEDVLRALQTAAPFVRRQLAPRLELREVPQIRFLHDDSIERGARVDELLRKIAEGKPIDEDEERS
ncbi:MAG TPA: 30S ribosome-binding factor RbfA [Candidatus Eisenbacteria bacterium]|nr:30S ribosome-binding factor RbfA [Candidatus Eisenbacteria bacterium]